jgi:hypothetical protein
VRGAETQARLGHPSAGRRTHRERDPEVGHHRPAVVQQDVLGLDVPVDHPVPVGVVERVGHLPRDPDRLVHAELGFAIELGTEGFAVDERHDVEEEAIRRTAIEQGQDVWMLERRRGGDLLHEALGPEHGGQLGLQHLEGDPPPVLQVLGEVHRGHSALAELALDQVAARQGGGQAFERIRHRMPKSNPGAPRQRVKPPDLKSLHVWRTNPLA